MKRRNFIKASILSSIVGGILTPKISWARPSNNLTIALLHNNTMLGNIESNCRLIEEGMRIAAAQGAKWIITPELCLTGYSFPYAIGTSWIEESPDHWVVYLSKVAEELKVTLFLSHIEKVNKDELYNSLFVIKQGKIIGRHRKINTIPKIEDWAKKGESPTMVIVDGVKVGLLICADAWSKQHANTLRNKGSYIIICSASWAPGEYGPGKTWENRSAETSLPIIVCNRTGKEGNIDLHACESVISYQGNRLFSHTSKDTSVVVLKWDLDRHELSKIDIY